MSEKPLDLDDVRLRARGLARELKATVLVVLSKGEYHRPVKWEGFCALRMDGFEELQVVVTRDLGEGVANSNNRFKTFVAFAKVNRLDTAEGGEAGLDGIVLSLLQTASKYGARSDLRQ